MTTCYPSSTFYHSLKSVFFLAVWEPEPINPVGMCTKLCSTCTKVASSKIYDFLCILGLYRNTHQISCILICNLIFFYCCQTSDPVREQLCRGRGGECCPIMEPATGCLYLSILLRWTESACTGSPSAPSQVCPWSPGVCQSHCSRRWRRATSPCSPLPWRKWAVPWSCCCCDGEEEEEVVVVVVVLLHGLAWHTVSAHRRGGEAGAAALYGPQKCWHHGSFLLQVKPTSPEKELQSPRSSIQRSGHSEGRKGLIIWGVFSSDLWHKANYVCGWWGYLKVIWLTNITD